MIDAERRVDEPETSSEPTRSRVIAGVEIEEIVRKLRSQGFFCSGPHPDINVDSDPIMAWVCERTVDEDVIEVKVALDDAGNVFGMETQAAFESHDDPERASEGFFALLVDLGYADLTAEEAIAFVRRNADTGGSQEIGGVRFEFFHSEVGPFWVLTLLANQAKRFVGGPVRG